MSTYFDAPVSGSGDGTITVNAKSLNNGTSSRSAVLSISNGEKTVNSTLYQRFKPTFSRTGQGNIPSSGGSMTVSVNSQYPFYFRNNPSNIGAITSGGVDYKDNPSISGGSWTFNVSVGANATTSGKTETLEMAFQKLDGTYSFNNPDAGDYSFTFYQESGSTTPIGIISISTPANVAASATSIPYSVTANMQSTINTFKDNVSYSTFSVQSGTTSGNLSISANGNSASPITYRFEGTTSDNQGFATASTIQNAADAPIVSGNTVNVPIYFDSDGVNIWIGVGQALPFVLRPSVVIEHSQGNRELINYVIPISETAVTFDDGNNQPFYVSDFDTSSLNYISIAEVYAGSGAPSYTVTYGDTEYYIYWSEDYSANFRTYLENVGNNCLDEVTWGEEPYVPVPYEQQYFTIELKGGGTVRWNRSIQYSDDNGTTWKNWITNTPYRSQTPVKLLFKKYVRQTSSFYKDSTFTVNTTGTCSVYGNILSLFEGDNFASASAVTAFQDYAFKNFFSGCTALTDAENLIFPEMPNGNGIFFGMFRECTNLVKAPKILPSSTLKYDCYSLMFKGCTSLVKAPELPARTLVDSCYYQMFDGCTSLAYVKCLATDISASNCTRYWLKGVSATGTFVKDANMSSWGTGTSGIPVGWTVTTT